MGAERPGPRWNAVPFGALLDESMSPAKLGQGGFTTLQNGVYRRYGSAAKRTGSSPFVTTSGGAIGANPVKAGYRWYRGYPSAFKQTIVQSGDSLYTGNDGTGAMTLLDNLTAGTSAAWFTSMTDPAESGVTGTPKSDVMICTYGSGAPIKYDGTYVTPLSSSITNHFTGCTYWHNYVWFWGDPNNPGAVYACDLNNPEGFTFMTNYGPYPIGSGDGDPFVQACVPMGNTMYVIKQSNVYAMTGFDFNSGAYQFQVQPVITGYGISSPFAWARLRTSLILWTGQQFVRLYQGATDIVPMGTTIPYTSALIAQGSQAAIRGIGGDFLVQGVAGPQTYSNVALFAVDVGSGYADTVMMYDDDASNLFGNFAWSTWKLPVGAWIPYGLGGSGVGSGVQDLKTLYFGDPQVGQLYQLGANATADVKAGNNITAIPFVAETGLLDTGTPDIIKHLGKVYLDVIANSATFSVTVVSDIASAPSQNQPTTSGILGGKIGTATLGPTGTAVLGPAGALSYQSLEADIKPSLDGKNYQVTLTESSTSAAYEIVGINLEFEEESYKR